MHAATHKALAVVDTMNLNGSDPHNVSGFFEAFDGPIGYVFFSIIGLITIYMCFKKLLSRRACLKKNSRRNSEFRT